MQYMLFIHSDESLAEATEEETAAMVARYSAVSEAMRVAGVLVASERLRPSATSAVVRVDGDELLVTDGPFAETKEAIGGFYLIDVAGRDEAIAWARKLPAAEYGAVEVRPIWDMADRGDA